MWEGTRVQQVWLSYAQEVPVAVTGRSVKRVPASASNATEPNGDMGLDAAVQVFTHETSMEGGSYSPWGETPAVIWKVTGGREHYQCQAPGCCCRRNLHEHCIVFRSHGGSNKLHNMLTLCIAHHLRCVHEGHLVIRGRAPHKLTFIFAPGRRA
ncbi:MAG: hypothetical protein RDV48_08405 [Candidatus Eremiobacteraeota bacterium]|nr:hypothetical protein [Candidatus Eremiobacteraeota bacterium]